MNNDESINRVIANSSQGDLYQYDISDPFHPVLQSVICCGGVLGKLRGGKARTCYI